MSAGCTGSGGNGLPKTIYVQRAGLADEVLFARESLTDCGTGEVGVYELVSREHLTISKRVDPLLAPEAPDVHDVRARGQLSVEELPDEVSPANPLAAKKS
jgi:hypothetical protein